MKNQELYFFFFLHSLHLFNNVLILLFDNYLRHQAQLHFQILPFEEYSTGKEKTPHKIL